MKLNLTISIIRLVFEASKRQWQNDSLRNLIELSNGKSMTKSRMTLDGDYPVYGANGIIGRANEALINAPTITIGRVGSCGEINKTVDKAWVSDNAMWVSSHAESLDFDYLYFGLKSLELTAGMKIAAMPSISQENVFRENIPLPPLAEQKRIAFFLNQYVQGLGVENCIDLPDSINAIKSTVARVESLAARVNEAQRLREDAENEIQVLIASWLNKLVGDLEQKYDTGFLEELLTDSNYGTSVKCHSERTNDAIPVLRIPNVASEKVTLTDMKYGVLSEAEYKKTVLSKGDILVVRTNGSKDLVGRCAVVPALPESMAFASYMIRLRCDKEIVLPEYLQLVLRQQRTGGYLFDFARTTAGQYNVSLGRLKNTKIPVPPLDEQRRIVAYLDGLQGKVNELRELQSRSGEELSALMPSVLDKAFKGEL